MFKKVGVVILAVVALAIAFWAGGKFQGRKTDDDYRASIAPASVLANAVRTGENLDGVYGSTSDIYKQSTSLDEFKASVNPLKDAVGDGNSTYRGDSENISSFTLIKPDKTYELTVGTTKADGQWVVTSISVNEQIRQ